MKNGNGIAGLFVLRFVEEILLLTERRGERAFENAGLFL